MTLTTKNVQFFAEQMRIAIPEEQLHVYKKRLDNLLDFFQVVEDYNGTNDDVPFRNHNMPLYDDHVEVMHSVEPILKNAPEEQDGFFVVPKIIESDTDDTGT